MIGRLKGLLEIRSERELRIWLIALTAIILIFKILIIPYPWPELPPEKCIHPPIEGSKCGFIFDEAHYIPAVRKMLRGEAANNEHPPLSKALMMLGILVFGDNPYGWRTLITLCGAISVYLVGILAYELTKSFRVSVTSAALFGFDITSFNLSSIAMLDAPALTFCLLGAILYLRRRLILSGLAFGLAMLSKTSAPLALLAILLYEFMRSLHGNRSLKGALRSWLKVAERLGFVALLAFVSGLAVYDYGYNAFSTPFEHMAYILTYHSSLTFSEGDVVDMPLSWTNPIFQFPRRSYYVVGVSVDHVKSYHPIAYYGMQTPLWWMTWAVFCFSAYFAHEKLKGESFPKLEVFTLSWFFSNYLIYFPLAHILHRWVYPFYFYTTVPVIAISFSSMLQGDRISEAVLYIILAAQICWFLGFFPVKPLWFIDFLLWLGAPA